MILAPRKFRQIFFTFIESRRPEDPRISELWFTVHTSLLFYSYLMLDIY